MLHLKTLVTITRSDEYDLVVVVIDGEVSNAALLLGAGTNARPGTRQLTDLKVMSSEGVEVERGTVEEVGIGLKHPLFGARIDPVNLNFYSTEQIENAGVRIGVVCAIAADYGFKGSEFMLG